MNRQLLAIYTLLVCIFSPSAASADFQLNLNIGPQQQVIATEVYFDVSLGFSGDPGDYLDSLTLSLSNNSLPLNFDYTRFSLRNLQNNFQGSGPFSNVGVAAITLSSPNNLPTGATLALGELVLDVSGLTAGSYDVTFNAGETDGSGVLGGNINEFLQDVGGSVNSNLRSVSVIAVPEPASVILIVGFVSGCRCIRRRLVVARPTTCPK